LFIHLEPAAMLVLNKTCRYCPRCDLLIAHRGDLEDLMARFFAAHNPKILGHDYIVIGTVNRAAWRRGRGQPMEPREMLNYLNEFKKVVRFELIGGWRPRVDTGR
jgi:Zn-finger nucleic acid-binding protein